MILNIKTIAVILIAVIVTGFFLVKKNKKNKLRKKVLADGDDYSTTAKNIALSMSKSKELYKSLITKVHPDRFPNDIEKQKKAEQFSAMLTEAKRNYSQLIEIKNLIETELY